MTDFWNGLGWMRTGVWPALSVAAFEGTTQVEVPPLSIVGFIQTSLPGWCLKVASVVDVVVWMMVGNPSTDKERRTVVCKERRAFKLRSMWEVKPAGWALVCRRGRFWKSSKSRTRKEALKTSSAEWNATAGV